MVAEFIKIMTVITLRQHIPMPVQSRFLRHLAVLGLSFDRYLLEYLSANPTGTKTTPICFVDPPMPLADSGSPGPIRPEDRVPRAICTAASVAVPRLSPFWAPVSQRTSPGSRATNVHEAQRRRVSVPCVLMQRWTLWSCPQTSLHVFPARRSYLPSTRCH